MAVIDPAFGARGILGRQLLENRERLFALAHGLQNVRLELPEKRIVRVAHQQKLEFVQRGLELLQLEKQVRVVEARQDEIRRELETARQQRQRVLAAAEADLRARHQVDRVRVVGAAGEMFAEFAHGAIDIAAGQKLRDLLQRPAAHGPLGVKCCRRERVIVLRRACLRLPLHRSSSGTSG